MAKISFTSRRQAKGFACMAIGGLLALLLLSLPLLLSIETWPPWGDLALDQDGLTARATTTGRRRAMSGKTKGRGDTSWMLEVRFSDGPHAGRIARVFCTIDWKCPLNAGDQVAVEVARDDAAVARLRGRRFSVVPLGLFVFLLGSGLASALVAAVGAWLLASEGRRARGAASR